VQAERETSSGGPNRKWGFHWVFVGFSLSEKERRRRVERAFAHLVIVACNYVAGVQFRHEIVRWSASKTSREHSENTVECNRCSMRA